MSKASIIIPTRNRPDLLLQRSLPSALDQTFDDYEILIIDDASEKKYIVPKYQHVYYHKNKKRMGLAYNRNLGADLATGEYIVSLDDDNELHPDFLSRTVAYLEKHLDVAAVGVGKQIIYPEGAVYQAPPTRAPCSINDGWLMRKRAFKTIRCDEGLYANEDMDLGLRFTKQFKVGAINELLMVAYGSAIINRSSYSDTSMRHLDGLKKFFEKNKQELKKYPKEFSYQARLLGRYYYLGGRRREAQQYLSLAWNEDKTLRNFFYLATAQLNIFKQFYITEQKLKRLWLSHVAHYE